MYKNYKVKVPFKAKFDDVFTGQKETVEFLKDQTIEGRLDIVNFKTILTLSSGLGGMVNGEFFEEVTE